ncbi:hypothetical protein H4S02_011671 [Coemansia sp. RSA 2611]|nr:hypothetical protein H4S02_011671 [Coemansia sp. RSA 2611]KAJ2366441.1 hypothetical protein H4S01_002712 [Coemansia sp. RSA 2610]
MRAFKAWAVLAISLAAVHGLTEKEDQTVTDILAILKRGTSVYPLEDLMHTLSVSMGFTHSARRLNRFVPGSKDAYATVYDMLLSVDTNGKHTAEQHAKLRQLIDIIGTRVLKLNAKDVNFRTLVVQEEEDDQGGERQSASKSAAASQSTVP